MDLLIRFKIRSCRVPTNMEIRAALDNLTAFGLKYLKMPSALLGEQLDAWITMEDKVILVVGIDDTSRCSISKDVSYSVTYISIWLFEHCRE